jgi:hypothetical protein
MEQDVIMIRRSSTGYAVEYTAVLNGTRDVWRAYDTNETVEQIKAYVAHTYPTLTPAYDVED